MIQTWKYVNPPEDIDLSVQLMPERDETDNRLYGIDPAWLREVISIWNAMIGDNPVGVDMPEYPEAAYTNSIRSLARGLKFRQENPDGIPGRRLLLTQGMTAKFNPLSVDTTQYKVTFGDVPANVESGDPVKKTDVSDMYDWMNKDVKYVRFFGQSDYTTTGYQVQTHVDGVGQLPSDLYDHQPWLYTWSWYYSNGTDRDEYGYWYKTVANDFTVTFTLSHVSSEFIKSSVFFIRAWATVQHFTEIENHQYFIPLQNVQVEDTADGLKFTGTVSANAIRNAFSVQDIPYKQDMQGDASYYYGLQWLGVNIGASNQPAQVCGFLEIKSDYRHPAKA